MIEVVACFMPHARLGERAEAILAIDGSRSMRRMFGRKDAFFNEPNYVEAVARKIGNILSGYASSGQVTVVFWAVGLGGSQVQTIGTFDASGCGSLELLPPKSMGDHTQLLPVLKHICEKISSEADGTTFGVIITDGFVEDLDDAKKYCMQIGQELASGKRKPLRLVLIGVGSEVREWQFEELECMFERTPLEDKVDLFSWAMASTMEREREILGPLLASLGYWYEEETVAPFGAVLDDRGSVVRDYPHGLPSRLLFTLPKCANGFIVRTPNGDVTQDISEGLGTP